jgi:hypothetical protein
MRRGSKMEMTDAEWKRWVFRRAIKNGWPGKEPASLETFRSVKEFEAAERFLIRKGMLSGNRATDQEAADVN